MSVWFNAFDCRAALGAGMSFPDTPHISRVSGPIVLHLRVTARKSTKQKRYRKPRFCRRCSPRPQRHRIGGIGGDVQVQPELSNRGSSRPCTSEGRLPRSERDSGNPGRRIAWVRCSRESPHRPAANRSFSKVKFPFLAAPNIRITGRIRLRRIRNLLICIYVHIYRKIKNKARESSYSSRK